MIELQLSNHNSQTKPNSDAHFTTELYEELKPLVLGIIKHRVKLNFSRKHSSTSDFDDLFQEVMMKLVQRLESEGPANNKSAIDKLHAYAAIVTHNVCNDHLKRISKSQFESLDEILFSIYSSDQLNIHNHLQNVECLRSIWKESSAISVDQRRAYFLTQLDALSGEGLLISILTYKIASIKNVCKILDFSEEQLKAILYKLPMKNSEVALLLSAETYQIATWKKRASNFFTPLLCAHYKK